MFWSKDVSRLERKNGELELEVINLKNQIEALNLQIEENQKKAKADAAVATMVIDFDNMDIFSIERNVSDGVGHTIIGYWLVDQYGAKSNQEWFLFCSVETHEKLVSEFKKHMKAEKVEN